jgi:hypothetical protein
MKSSAVLGLALIFSACGPQDTVGRTNASNGTNGGRDGGVTCSDHADSDGDGISDTNEGARENPPRDTDHDGTPDFQDNDSDGDGIPDSVEARNGGNPCTPPVDSDGDGKADFRDLDSDDANDASVPDTAEAGPDLLHPIDTNNNNAPDYMDPDNDGDAILDVAELVPQGQSVAAITLADAPDTDFDGTPDFRDTDSDNDTILDSAEGVVDTDGDLVGNWRDLDSDGDCVPDSAEAGDVDPNTPPVDTDLDGAPDFEDTDSDNDGLTDGKEDKSCDGVLNSCETSRVIADSDGDMISDLIEYEDCSIKSASVQIMTNCMCDGADANKSPLTRGDFVFVSDYMKLPVPDQETLNLTTDVSRADVVFMLDVTGSMGACATNMAQNLASVIVPGVRAAVRDAAFGVVAFADFLDTDVVRYDYKIQTVRTMASVDAANNQSIVYALNHMALEGGGDLPEAGWEALYSIVADPAVPPLTGGVTVTTPPPAHPKWTSAIVPRAPNALLPGEEQGTIAQAKFRTGAIPIVVAISDDAFHDKPGVAASGEDGLFDYGSGTDCPSNCAGVPSRQDGITRVNALGGHVIGLAVTGGSDNPLVHLTALAQATGAVVHPADFVNRGGSCSATQCCTGSGGAGVAPVGGNDCPLGYTVTRQTSVSATCASPPCCPASQSIVDGIAALARGLTFDVHVVASDVDPNTVDNFIEKLVPNVSGVGPAAMCVVVPMSQLVDNFVGPKALPNPNPPGTPADGLNDTFIGLSGAVQICFDVVAKQNNNIMNTDQPQIFRAQLQVIGQTKTNNMTNSFNLGTPRDVFFLVPPVIVNGPIN